VGRACSTTGRAKERVYVVSRKDRGIETAKKIKTYEGG
jgi:hypothetical protein